jgi:hypothetical protein
MYDGMNEQQEKRHGNPPHHSPLRRTWRTVVEPPAGRPAGRVSQRQLRGAGYDVTTDIVELRDIAVDIANNFVTGYAPPRLAEVIAGVEASDGIIAVSTGVQCVLQRPVQVLH